MEFVSSLVSQPPGGAKLRNSSYGPIIFLQSNTLTNYFSHTRTTRQDIRWSAT
jgi:hypothetical protein